VHAIDTRFPAGGRWVERQSSERLERILFWIFVAGLAWCPFWLGSNRDIAWGVNAILFPSLAVAYEAYLLLTGKEHPVSVRVVAPSAALFAAVVIWIVVQNATWMPSGLQHPIWSMTAEVLERPVAGSITVDRDLTTLALVRLITAAAVFWISLQLCRDTQRAVVLIQCIAVCGVLYAAYGLFAFAFAPGTVLWFDNPRMTGRLTSTFVNRNSYATYAGIGLVATTGLIIQIFRDEIASAAMPLKIKMIRFIEFTGRRAALLLGAAAVILAALLATVSRGGILATICGLVALVTIVVTQEQKKSNASLLRVCVTLIMFLLLFVAGFFVFGAAFAGRMFDEGIADTGRLGVYRITIRSILDAPWLGYGYGTFENIFAMIRDRSFPIYGIWDKSHNSYLDILQGLGLVFGSMLILSIVLLLFKCMRGAGARRQNAIVPAIATAVTLVVGAHALVDFSLEIQAVTLTFMAVLGAGVAQSESSRVALGDS
jgi:O-antigen ligase